jgi:prepilin signal peptidase PulO-like enzyme (type II secretory pathway)
MENIFSDPAALFDNMRHVVAQVTPNLPLEGWWVAALVLLALGVAAGIDSYKAIVPDPLILFPTIGLVGAMGVYKDWPFSAHQLTWGIIAAVIIWGINELWYRYFKQDALGLGDAKWSLLAVTCFGAGPVLIAWGIGAIIGSLWIGTLKVLRKPITHVHFAPFLFIGLLVGLWFLRLSDF